MKIKSTEYVDIKKTKKLFKIILEKNEILRVD